MTGSGSENNEFDGLDGQLPGFPGYLLRQAREEKGLSQMEIARELHLTSRVLDGLENDDFTHVNSAVFARGYIRSYARYLSLDPDALVAEYDAVYGSPDHSKKPMTTIRQGAEETHPGDTWVKLVSIVIVLALVGASWWWWQGQQNSVATSAIGEVTVQDSQGEDVAANLPEDDALDLQLGKGSDDVGATDEAAQEQTVTEAVAEVATATVPTPASISEPEATATAPAAPAVAVKAVAKSEEKPAVAEAATPAVAKAIEIVPGQGLLVIEFIDDCWVEIQDDNGTMVMADLKSKGQVLEMAITAPAQLLLGRATAIGKIEFAQRSIDLEPYTRKDIARVTLEL